MSSTRDHRCTIIRRSVLVAVAFSCTSVFDTCGFADVDLAKAVLNDVPAKVADRNGLRGEHRDSYLQLLDIVRTLPVEDLQRQAAANRLERENELRSAGNQFAFSQFADIVKNPELWQGKAVRIVGHANRIVKYSVNESASPADELFESWVVTDDSQQYPTVVVAHEVPTGTPIGESEVIGVDATGILFQVFTYNARDGRIRYAPLIIANGWTTPAPPAASAREWLLAGLTFVFAISIAWHLVKFARKRPRRRVGSTASFDGSFDEPTSEQESA